LAGRLPGGGDCHRPLGSTEEALSFLFGQGRLLIQSIPELPCENPKVPVFGLAKKVGHQGDFASMIHFFLHRRTIAACLLYGIKPFVCQIAPKLVCKTLALSYATNEEA
jgi:hypothetical protein